MCMDLDIPKDACYLRISKNKYRCSEELGVSARGEDVWVDYDGRGKVIGIELIDHTTKPCQMCERPKRKVKKK